MWLWVIIVAAALILLIVLIWAAPKGLEAQRNRKRREAGRLRMDAERKLAGAEQSEESAQRAAERVAAERTEAARLAREVEARQARADELEEIAENESQLAREQRTAAERTARQAQAVDPTALDPDDGFDVEKALRGASAPDRSGDMEPPEEVSQ